MSQTVTIVIPDEALPMVEAAARGFGWQPQLTNESGVLIDNPQSALQRILVEAISMTKNVAINQIAQSRAEIARAQAVAEMTAVANSWLATLGGGQ